ncbi:MAG: 16S rRNA (guanine(966)-N(2))-methyltransferase RsmD [Venatoribacter sp.]
MSKTQSQQLRIIGGQWRSRRLNFPAIEGLRPTLDRIRETVFNWLQFEVEGKQVLDCFAGSGALGLEALSRGAKNVTFVEKNSQAAKQLNANLALLNCSSGRVVNTDALVWLVQTQESFDLVFLDPPFHLGLLQPALDTLKLNANALVYVEHETELVPCWPAHWQEIKSKATKEFCFRLFRVATTAS